jgi:hypothetical protein
MKTAAQPHPINMKFPAPRFLTRRRLIGLSIVVFVFAGALVGFASQPQLALGPSFGSYGPANGSAVPVAPGVNQQVTIFGTTAATAAAPAGSYSTSFGGRQVEVDAYLTIQVQDLKAATDQAAKLATLYSGYVAASSFDDSGSSASVTLRIPEGNFSSAMHTLSSLGIIKAQSISSNDVTEQYVNLQAQLDSYTSEEAALLRILNSSKTVTEALDTENAIQNTQAQINDLTGQLQVIKRLVAFATINIQLMQPAPSPTLDFGDALNSALLAFYTVVKGMLILGASLAPIAIIGVVVYVPFRHFSRKKLKPNEAH